VRYLKFPEAACLFFVAINLIPATAFGQTSASAPREISLIVTVTDDEGRFASGVERESFSVFEKNTQLQITSFETFDKPTSVVFLFDLSGSMEDRGKDAAVEAAYQFVQKSNRDNDYLVIGFDEKIKSITDWGSDRDGIKKALTEVLQHKPKNETALYDACDVVLKKLESSKYATRVLMLFTDGQDNMSKLSFKRLLEELKESSVSLYAIGLLGGSDVGNALGMEGQGVLDELASVTGARAYYPRTDKELQDVLDQIALELSHRYTIRFNSPAATADGKWHTIKIKLTVPPRDSQGNKYPHLNVRSRLGYYDR
jgi:Ca-activated chloride channel family protein